MSNAHVFFDKANNRVGFGPQSTCPSVGIHTTGVPTATSTTGPVTGTSVTGTSTTGGTTGNAQSTFMILSIVLCLIAPYSYQNERNFHLLVVL